MISAVIDEPHPSAQRELFQCRYRHIILNGALMFQRVFVKRTMARIALENIVTHYEWKQKQKSTIQTNLNHS